VVWDGLSNYALYPHMSVFETWRLVCASLCGKAARELKVREARRSWDRGAPSKKPGHLSGGQKQRVAIGVRCSAAKVFLFDELFRTSMRSYG